MLSPLRHPCMLPIIIITLIRTLVKMCISLSQTKKAREAGSSVYAIGIGLVVKSQVLYVNFASVVAT